MPVEVGMLYECQNYGYSGDRTGKPRPLLALGRDSATVLLAYCTSQGHNRPAQHGCHLLPPLQSFMIDSSRASGVLSCNTWVTFAQVCALEEWPTNEADPCVDVDPPELRPLGRIDDSILREVIECAYNCDHVTMYQKRLMLNTNGRF